MQANSYIAHVGKSTQDSHPLDNHLYGVAQLAKAFAFELGAEGWLCVASLWHDLGKYGRDFQNYIRSNSGFEAHLVDDNPSKVNHSSAGALLAIDKMPDIRGRILAYLIAGHHAGLADWFGDETGVKCLEDRLQSGQQKKLLEHALAADIPEDILNPTLPNTRPSGGTQGLHLWIRLLFSSLVDADFLDTEKFMDGGKTNQRSAIPPLLSVLLTRLNAFLGGKMGAVDPTPLNAIRADVLRQCRSKAAESPGVFTLTVPTGGGKTLSSLAFALEHATIYHKSRVIYAIPYTSIIEQTAEVFRSIFDDAVLEHHSNFDPDKETPQSRLTSENWDAPLIVTTNVQLFESLFAVRTSRCRKLHNLVNSVIVLDEAQLLPPEFLQPILNVMRLLSEHYGVTFVLCTATQPALNSRKDGFGTTILNGLDDCREIIADPKTLYDALNRVDVTLPVDISRPTDWATLAAELIQYEQVLVIVNTRKQCRELHQAMPPGTIHLSALMCGEHRSRVIAEIRAKLKAKEPVRVISTQLVEAGVDIDFPFVYRALAGLDSIAQAAGRCNREGVLPGRGKLVIFVPPSTQLMGMMKFGEQACRNVLHEQSSNLLSPENLHDYFKAYYGQLGREGLDKYGIDNLLTKNAYSAKIQFRTAADKFCMIDESQSVSVIVPYCNPDKTEADSGPLIQQLRSRKVYRELTRKLQRYTVSLRKHEFDTLDRKGEIEEPLSGFYILKHDTGYHNDLGLLVDESIPGSPEKYLC